MGITFAGNTMAQLPPADQQDVAIKTTEKETSSSVTKEEEPIRNIIYTTLPHRTCALISITRLKTAGMRSKVKIVDTMRPPNTTLPRPR